jgi:antirestriction protein
MESINPPKGAFETPQAPELTIDERAIQLGIEAARAEEREVDDAVARALAAQLHGGQDTALYSLASTGSLEDERLEGELRELYRDPNPQVLEWASVLGTYALHREHRGPVEGWATLWPDTLDPVPANEYPAAGGPADDAEARASLMQRLNAAGVATLGQVATIYTAHGMYGRDAGERDHADVDTFPWTDAVRWRPDGGADELGDAEAAVVAGVALEELFAQAPVDAFGSREDMGWCGLVRRDERPGGAILQENPYGRRSAWVTDSDEELAARWQQLQEEHEAYQGARFAAEGNRGVSPEVWVGSLADYTAGYLHGGWLDATSDPEELAAAVQFILRNSHEPDAEEYGIFDYDGFGEVTSLLGEYPSLKTVSRIAQGIFEHGHAYAAWAAYVGPEHHEQLERFEDHYLGEWESLEAYAQELLEESEAYRVIDEAPEWLRPYLSIDVEDYARDLGYELHVVEKPDGGVWVFDGRA